MKSILSIVTALCIGAAVMANAADSEKKEVELKGKIGCSHCAYKVKGQECGVSFKTADGKVYTLDKPSKELMDARFDGGQLKVKGTVTEKDGNLFVTASSAELVK